MKGTSTSENDYNSFFFNLEKSFYEKNANFHCVRTRN